MSTPCPEHDGPAGAACTCSLHARRVAWLVKTLLLAAYNPCQPQGLRDRPVWADIPQCLCK